MGGLIGLIVFSQLLELGNTYSNDPVLDDEFIRTINEEGKGFRAKLNNFFEGMTLNEARKITANTFSTSSSVKQCPASASVVDLPARYNFLKKHMICSTPILNQGQTCSSAFAAAVVGSFNKRYCYMNNGLKKFDGSIQHPLACDEANQACEGGSLSSTLDLAVNTGFVTSMCMSYSPATADQCETDRLARCHRRKADSYCVVSGVEAIKREIYENGPVAAVIPLTRELMVYGSGVYTTSSDTQTFSEKQAVMIVGWGVSADKTPYWIIENSWGETWGIKGLAKVKIGFPGSTLDQ